MESNGPQRSPGKSLWHVVRAIYYMLLKGVCKHSLALDLHLLFKRGKIAGGRALSGLLTSHHHLHHKTAAVGPALSSAFSCRSMDPAAAVYAPREVEFSCSNTPSFPSLYGRSRGPRHHRDSRRRSGRRDSLHNYDAAAIARVFEVLNSDAAGVNEAASPALHGRSCTLHRARQRTVADSDSGSGSDSDSAEGGGGGGGEVDREAEEFIRWFRGQLRSQTYAATPE